MATISFPAAVVTVLWSGLSPYTCLVSQGGIAGKVGKDVAKYPCKQRVWVDACKS